MYYKKLQCNTRWRLNLCRAQGFENSTGEKSAQRIARQRGYKIIETATTWAELHEGFKQTGLRFEKKGSGAIIFVGDIAIKAGQSHE